MEKQTEIDSDWYTYLAEEFKIDRNQYQTKDRVVVDCPECSQTRTIRLNHLKAQIKRNRSYSCGLCAKKRSLLKAREKFKEKYGSINPGQLKGKN